MFRRLVKLNPNKNRILSCFLDTTQFITFSVDYEIYFWLRKVSFGVGTVGVGVFWSGGLKDLNPLRVVWVSKSLESFVLFPLRKYSKVIYISL